MVSPISKLFDGRTGPLQRFGMLSLAPEVNSSKLRLIPRAGRNSMCPACSVIEPHGSSIEYLTFQKGFEKIIVFGLKFPMDNSVDIIAKQSVGEVSASYKFGNDRNKKVKLCWRHMVNLLDLVTQSTKYYHVAVQVPKPVLLALPSVDFFENEFHEMFDPDSLLIRKRLITLPLL